MKVFDDLVAEYAAKEPLRADATAAEAAAWWGVELHMYLDIVLTTATHRRLGGKGMPRGRECDAVQAHPLFRELTRDLTERDRLILERRRREAGSQKSGNTSTPNSRKPE